MVISTDWQTDFKRTLVAPEDVLTAAATIEVSQAHGCNWFAQDWIKPSIYLDWAKRSLASGQDDYALSNALSYAKRTTCRIIDGLVLGNHLRCYIGKSYPKKIQALGQIGISVPEIVHELIIDPRNQLEHEYVRPDVKDSEHAVQIAELFVGAMREESQRQPIVAIAWNVQASYSVKWQDDQVHEHVKVHGFTPDPMLFIDIFEELPQAKIVHPGDGEIYYAGLKDFAEEESIKLAAKLRSDYVRPSGFSGMSVFFYREVKCQARI